MNLCKTIQDLYAEREKLEHVIAFLEDLQRTAGGAIPSMPKDRKPRGRKNMGAEERREVSARMKKYWANHRNGKYQTP